MNDILRQLFFLCFIRPLVLIVLGINIRHRERLPDKGPAILVANHNSHLDTMVLMSIFPMSVLKSIRPVAAADYFLKNKLISWFSLNIIKIIPIKRSRGQDLDKLFEQTISALEEGEIVILFPEGSRGEPEKLSGFKSGISYLSQKVPEVPITPIFLHGLGKALPRNDWLLVPFFCDIFVGEDFYWTGSKDSFMAKLDQRMSALAEEGEFAPWE